MKKLLTILVTILMLFALIGCSTNPGNANFFDNVTANYKEVEDGLYEANFDYEVYYRYDNLDEEVIHLVNETNMCIKNITAYYECYDTDGNLLCEQKASNIFRHIEPNSDIYLNCKDITSKYSKNLAEVRVTKFIFEKSSEQELLNDKIEYNIEYTPDTNDPDWSLGKITVTNNYDKKLNVTYCICGLFEGKVTNIEYYSTNHLEPGETRTVEEEYDLSINTSETDDIKYIIDVTLD